MFYSYLHYTIRTLIVQVKPPNSRRKSRVCGGNSSNGKILIQSRDYFALSEKCKQRYRCHVCIWKSWAFSKRCSRVFKIKNQKNRRNAVKSTFLPLLINAADRNRTIQHLQNYRKKGGFSTSSIKCNQKCNHIFSFKMTFDNTAFFVIFYISVYTLYHCLSNICHHPAFPKGCPERREPMGRRDGWASVRHSKISYY